MKDTIYTIPVTEAFAESGKSDCAFCVMHGKLNESSIEFVMGPSYMEDDVRMETNKTGFCKSHMEQMYSRPNRLGLALMTHTRLMRINADLAPLLKDAGGAKKSLFGGKKNGSPSDGTVQYLKKAEQSCYICAKTEDTFARYIDTYFHLWKKDAEIKKLTESSGGFCLNHFYALLEAGEKKLSASDYGDFLKTVVPAELGRLKELEADLDWFVRKFDYRNSNEPWKNSKDALLRALKKISSAAVSE